jgi:hypothetical protein
MQFGRQGDRFASQNGRGVGMSTRKLIVAALVTGMAILVAFAVQVLVAR